MESLKGKRAVVIGAGSVGEGIGNGRAITMLFAREGAQVMAADFNEDAAKNTVALIANEGGTAEPFVMDATNPKDVDAMVAHANSAFGGIDILVHVVGMSLPGGICETDPDDWDRVFDVNLKSAYLASRAVLPFMQAQGGGTLVFISSLVAEYSGPYSYAIDTPHVKAFISDAQSASATASPSDRAAAVPMKRQGSPWDIAQAALFLASDASSYITGVCLPVDGGLST